MSKEVDVFRKVVGDALTGEGAHVATADVFAGLDWKLSNIRPEGASHSIYELLQHMSYWQDWVLKWLDGKQPSIPKHASGSWPKATGVGSAKDWKNAERKFRGELRQLERWSKIANPVAGRGSKSSLEMLQKIASHNSYHAGEVVCLRQLVGSWPPPSGGLTW
jgi:uncharacterized damage-inducible protein DinB